MSSFVIKGDFVWCKDQNSLACKENGFAVCVDGICKGIFDQIPPEYKNLKLIDYTGKLIVPGLVDLHIHAPQFEFRGNGMDLELMDWLNTYTFPTESRYNNPDYARKAYSLFAEALKKSATTRVSIFATNSIKSTLILKELMEATGMVSYVGRTLADRLAPEALITPLDTLEKDVEFELKESEKFKNTKTILTPRFVPACTDELLRNISKIQKEKGLPLQSHLSENPIEIETVKQLSPNSKFYGDAYDQCGCFGTNGKTIMAHCVYSSDEEIELMKQRGVFVAHSPQSNLNISSGIAPIQKYLEKGLNVGLATDIAGGHSESMFRAVTDAIQVSKMYWRYIDSSYKPLTFSQALYIATLGGGAFFGKVGSFDQGYEFDAVVVKDDDIPSLKKESLEKRVERAFYLEMDLTSIVAKFCQGRTVNSRD